MLMHEPESCLSQFIVQSGCFLSFFRCLIFETPTLSVFSLFLNHLHVGCYFRFQTKKSITELYSSHLFTFVLLFKTIGMIEGVIFHAKGSNIIGGTEIIEHSWHISNMESFVISRNLHLALREREREGRGKSAARANNNKRWEQPSYSRNQEYPFSVSLQTFLCLRVWLC